MALGALSNAANTAAGAVGGPGGALIANAASAILGAFQGRDDYQVGFCFAVEIDGIMTAAFRQVSQVRWTTKTKPLREGGNNRNFVNLIEPGEFAPLTLKKGLATGSGANELFLWMKRVHDTGAFERANISLVLLDEMGDEAGRFNFYNAFPNKYELGQLDGKTNEIGIETLEITYDYFDFQAGGLLDQLLGAALGAATSMLGGSI